jgi:hypothetical protein
MVTTLVASAFLIAEWIYFLLDRNAPCSGPIEISSAPRGEGKHQCALQARAVPLWLRSR